MFFQSLQLRTMVHVDTGFTTEDVGKYYDEQSIIYNFNSADSFHLGIWDENTRDSQESQENTNKFVAELLELNKDDVVLDAGCGVGGPTIYMAEQYGVKITGITLSKVQVDLGTQVANNSSARNRISFAVQDYANTSFDDESFTKIFGIESVCHGPSKPAFIAEAFRLLKPGGKLVVADPFITKRELNKKEMDTLRVFLEGCCIPHLYHVDDFKSELEKAGFIVQNQIDYSDKIMKSVKNVHMNAILIYPLTKVLSKLKWIPQEFHETVRAGIMQKRLIKDLKVGIIGAVIAEKPH
ncbi:MAG: methyltransferase domain-containing protein [Candidatus Heimdallarchaeota archaeon]|nr:methyltransferase domain-containing protein [Candidatus Heimdallarchaeota archaeon]